jgi:hypothetical protein
LTINSRPMVRLEAAISFDLSRRGFGGGHGKALHRPDVSSQREPELLREEGADVGSGLRAGFLLIGHGRSLLDATIGLAERLLSFLVEDDAAIAFHE